MIEKLKKAIKRFLISLVSIFSSKAREVINEELGGGLLGIGEQDTDFLFGSSSVAEAELMRRGQVNRQVKYEYNQGAQYETRNWCTIYSAVTEVSWLMDYEFSLEEILEIGRGMVAAGTLDPDKGAYLHRAVDAVRHFWNNKFPNRKIASYRIEYSDKKLRHLLTHVNPRLTQLGYRTSVELFREIQLTGIANKKSYPLGGGHAVSQWGLATINNYKGKKLSGQMYKNRFSFTYIDSLIENKVIFNVGYMFLKV